MKVYYVMETCTKNGKVMSKVVLLKLQCPTRWQKINVDWK